MEEEETFFFGDILFHWRRLGKAYSLKLGYAPKLRTFGVLFTELGYALRVISELIIAYFLLHEAIFDHKKTLQ